MTMEASKCLFAIVAFCFVRRRGVLLDFRRRTMEEGQELSIDTNILLKNEINVKASGVKLVESTTKR